MQVCNCCFISKSFPRTRNYFHFHPLSRGFPGNGNPLSNSPRTVARYSNDIHKETERTLEWLSVCSQVSAFTSTNMALSISRNGNLPFGQSREESQKLLKQTAAALLLPQPLDFSGIQDISHILTCAASGELLTVRELGAVERTLGSARTVVEQLEKLSSDDGSSQRYSPLLEILQRSDILTGLEQRIDYCIDCSLSVILDCASKKLELIRLQRKKNVEKLETLLKEVASGVFQSGGMDGLLITKRRSRMCVGIRASHRSLLPNGVILDVSSSGATYFMEPKEAVELNNMEVRLSNSEKAEERLILRQLTSEIAHSEKEMRNLIERILELDLACARGAHARWINGVFPVLLESHRGIVSNNTDDLLSVDIEGIQHPLLLESSLKTLSSASSSNLERSFQMDTDDESMGSTRLSQGESDFPVPLDIKVKNTTKVVVISGPNTGGKTATMKTLGLASLMSKAGLYLPARHSPKLPWFDQVLADIGDHQSLEHNLSTFSGHISRLSKIMEVASEDSLVLIDEIGNGTDPSEGVALSTSILQYLADRIKLAVVTTHYADLSRLKSKDYRFENAAMDFSLETLLPTYRVLWGTTGNSNALTIAKSIGFNQKVLDRAHKWVEKLVPNKQTERAGLLYRSLMEERNVLEAQAQKAASVLSEVTKLYHEILSEAEDLDSRQAAWQAKASQQVRQELKTAKLEIDAIIMNFETKLKYANPEQINSLLTESDAVISSILGAHRANSDFYVKGSDSRESYDPHVGDRVHVNGFGNKLAIVVEVSGVDNNVVVQFGKMKVSVKKDFLKAVPTERNTTTSSFSHFRRQVMSQTRGGDPIPALTSKNQGEETLFSAAVQTSKNTIDLRGMRVEEATHQLSMAVSGSAPNSVLFVVHGMGTGVIKECALKVLKNHARVSRFEQESPVNYGCTIAYIK